jgi:hypothetical protein
LNCPDDNKWLQSSFIQGDIWYGAGGLVVFDKANVTLDVGNDVSDIDISFCLTISFDGVLMPAHLCGNKRKIDNKHHTKTHKMNEDSAIILKSDVV